jgi:hypothetical protein
MSSVKEPNYYSTDLHNRYARTPKEYVRLFRGANAHHIAVGEASVWYLYSDEAVPNILKEVPEAKFIVCLRNPVEMAYSLHGQQLVSVNEQLTDFNQAWNAQPQRAQGLSVTRFCQDHRLLLYGPICSFGEQLGRLFGLCDRRQIHVVFLEDIKGDAEAVYGKVLHFLDVPNDDRRNFEVVNAASERRSLRLVKAIKHANNFRRRLGIPRLGTGIMPLMNRLNLRASRRAPMNVATRKMLANYFRSDVERLEYVLEKKLGHWQKE